MNYGVANTTGQVSAAEVGAILDVARAAGINTLDTAIAYGGSEAVLGAQGLSGWNVVTKLPEMPKDIKTSLQVRGWVQDQFSASLARLKLEKIHAILLHRSDQILDSLGGEVLATLGELKQQGLTSKVGVSIYEPQELELITQVFQPDLVQAPLNILDNSFVTSGWAARLKAGGAEIHLRSAFLQGLLLMAEDIRPVKFDRWNPLWRQWHGWLQKHKITPLQACMRYSLSVQKADRVIVGVDSAAQLKQVFEAAYGFLPAAPKWNMSIDTKLVNPANWTQL
jgi:aryl-alcohol dehydrogenase-like predicted oxidoreductase